MGEQDITLSKLPAAHASHRGAVTIVVGALYSRLIRLLGTQQRERARKVERRRLFATSLDLILLVDRRGQFAEVSPSSAAILGYQPEEMIGRNGKEFLHFQDLEKTRKEMRSARAGHLMHNFECRHLHKDGRVVTLEWTGIWSEPEQRYFLIGRDMTVSRRNEGIKDEFDATVSHELRTPLTSIAASLALLAGGALPDSVMRLIAIANSCGSSLSAPRPCDSADHAATFRARADAMWMGARRRAVAEPKTWSPLPPRSSILSLRSSPSPLPSSHRSNLLNTGRRCCQNFPDAAPELSPADAVKNLS